MHVLVAVMVVVMTAVAMRMSVSHRGEADNVDYQTKHTDDEKFVQAAKLVALPNAFERIQNDFETHETSARVSR